MVYVIIVVQYNIQSISQSVWSVQFVVHLDRGMGLCGLLSTHVQIVCGMLVLYTWSIMEHLIVNYTMLISDAVGQASEMVVHKGKLSTSDRLWV